MGPLPVLMCALLVRTKSIHAKSEISVASALASPFIKSEAKEIHENMIRIVEKIVSIINPSLTTVVFDDYDDSSNALMFSLFSYSGSLQVSKDIPFSSILTLVVIESDIYISKLGLGAGFWNPKCYYFIFIKNQSRNGKELLSELWDKFKVYNVFIVRSDGDSLLSYNPFLGEVQELVVSDIRRKNVLNERFYDLKGKKLYVIYPGLLPDIPDKTESVVTGTYDDPIIRVISSILNARTVFLETGPKEQYGGRDKKGRYVGTYRWLVNGSAYMTGGAHFLDWDVLDSEIPFSHYITMEKLCFTVPGVGQVPHFKAILKLLNIFVMASILLMYIFAGLVFRFLRYLTHRTGLKKNLPSVEITLSIISILLGMSFHSKINTTFERMIIGSLLLVSFAITSAFQSTMTTVLSKPIYTKKVESKEELEMSGVEIWSTSKQIFSNLQKNGYSGVNVKLKPPNTRSEGFKVGWLAKVNVMLETAYLKYRTSDNYFTKECPATYSAVYFFNKGIPFKNRIDRIISVLIESGHVARWVKDGYLREENDLMYLKITTKETVTNKPLTLMDMKYIFLFFCYSLVMSSFVFIIELIAYFVDIKKLMGTKQY